MLLAGFEPEEESPIVFLRLRKAVRTRKLPVFDRAVRHPRRGEALGHRAHHAARCRGAVAATRWPTARWGGPAVERTARPGAVVLAGERLAEVPGAFSALVALARTTGARVAWIPRRAGERGAVEAGALPTLLPGGRSVADAAGRADVAQRWGVDLAGPRRSRPRPDRHPHRGPRRGLGGLLVGGVDPFDLPDPALRRGRARRAPASSSAWRCSRRPSPSGPTSCSRSPPRRRRPAPTWTGRAAPRPSTRPCTAPGCCPTAACCRVLADEMDVDLRLPTPEAARAELAALGTSRGVRVEGAGLDVRPPAAPAAAGEAVLATWRQLIDVGTLQRDEPELAGTARTPVARIAPGTAAGLGVADGDRLTVSGATGVGHPAGPDHPDARPGRLAADEVPGQRDPHRPRHRPRCRRARSSRDGRPAMNVARRDARPADARGLRSDVWWIVLIKIVGIFVILVVMTLFAIVFERKVVARMQQRIGPNRVGPRGYLQSLADGLKLAFKEDIMPALADKPVYFLAPVIAAVPAFLAFSVIPLGPEVCIFGARHAAAAHRPADRRAHRPRLLGDGRLRDRAGRLGLRLDVPAAGRPAQRRPDGLLRDRDGAVDRRGLPLRQLDVHLGHRRRHQAAADLWLGFTAS